MTLQEHLTDLEPTAQISLCNSNEWHTEPRSGNKCYDAFFVGAVSDTPAEALQKTVKSKFTAFMWNTTTFILEEV